MASFNKIILVGALTADSELKTTTDGIPLAQFTLAVNRPERTDGLNSNQVDFFKIVAWRDLAERIQKQFKKNSLVLIEGSIITRNYTTDAGQKRWVTEIEAREARLLSETFELSAQTDNKQIVEPVLNIAPPNSLESKKESGVSEQNFNFDSLNEQDNLQFPPQFGEELEEEIPF